ncbi:MAG TPA: ATP-dependent DNA helicase RecG [Candidatus Solibacter sp.]|nr:ATP-dependent DNA helicase RecG [Candidatus Solibacter sp.]
MTALAGVTPAYAKKLERLGILTVGDLLQHYPRRHEDFSRTVPVIFLADGAKQTVKVQVEQVRRRPGGRGRLATEAFLSDDSGRMKAIWFNQPYMAQTLHVGDEVVLSGKVQKDRRGGGLAMMNPAFERGTTGGLHTGRLVPLYPETYGLTSKWIRARIDAAMDSADQMRDEVPADVERSQALPSLPRAIRQVHYPNDEEELNQARKRIAFRQLLLMQIAVLISREQREHQVAPKIAYDVERARAIRDALPFDLTDAQRKAAHFIFKDMAEPRPMARLLQGDVGSGKTAVAAMAAAMASRAGYQTLLMAPTEILAQQHARTLRPYLEPLQMRMDLLVGSTTAANRRRILDELSQGDLDLLVGTHALIEPTVVPRSLGLVVSDEQHRFGVGQREALAQRSGTFPHVLSMTATPIPRTLQLTLYGDLTVSVLDQMPPGRQVVETRMVPAAQRQEAYDFVRGQVAGGRQVFVICPLVEDSDLIQARSATSEHERLQKEVFPEMRLALLHGRMKPAEKDGVMEAFKAGEFQILVSTSVVEVGVDVPNATVMMIEGAERFGLAQLHQFRGRVGRGEHKAFCLLLSDAEGADSADSNRRLDAMVRYSSGFDLAEEDLKIRGPGDLIGATGAQHGHDAGLLVAGLLDVRLIAAAREEAERLVRQGLDPAMVRAAQGFHIAGSLS